MMKSSRASRGAPSAPLITVTPRFTDYELHESPIGFGTESTVYLARHVPNDTFVALKCIVLEDEEATGGARRSSADKFDDVVEQLRLCRLLSHPKLLPVLSSFVFGQTLWIVSPLMPAGSVFSLLDNYFKEGLDEITVASIASQVVTALAYIHSQGMICHCLRAEHILVDTNGDVRLSGLNALESANEMESRDSDHFNLLGDFEWIAPEILSQDVGYIYKTDIYSFGITLLELTNGMTPYPDWPPLRILLHKLDNSYPPLHFCRHGLSRRFYALVSKCVDRNPYRRPDAKDILKSGFLRMSRGRDWVRKELVEKSIQLREASERGMSRQTSIVSTVDDGLAVALSDPDTSVSSSVPPPLGIVATNSSASIVESSSTSSWE